MYSWYKREADTVVLVCWCHRRAPVYHLYWSTNHRKCVFVLRKWFGRNVAQSTLTNWIYASSVPQTLFVGNWELILVNKETQKKLPGVEKKSERKGYYLFLSLTFLYLGLFSLFLGRFFLFLGQIRARTYASIENLSGSIQMARKPRNICYPAYLLIHGNKTYKWIQINVRSIRKRQRHHCQ